MSMKTSANVARAMIAATVALMCTAFSSVAAAQSVGAWWPTTPLGGDNYPWYAQTDPSVSVVLMRSGSSLITVKVSSHPSNNFGCATPWGVFEIESNNPQFKQIWGQLSLAIALGARVNVYVNRCSAGGLPIISDVVVRPL